MLSMLIIIVLLDILSFFKVKNPYLYLGGRQGQLCLFIMFFSSVTVLS